MYTYLKLSQYTVKTLTFSFFTNNLYSIRSTTVMKCLDLNVQKINIIFFLQVKLFNGILILEGVTIDDIGWYVCYTNGSKTRVMTGAKLDVEKSLGTKNYIYDTKIIS